MFLKLKARRVIKKISKRAPPKELEKAVRSVVAEASRQLSRKVSKSFR